MAPQLRVSERSFPCPGRLEHRRLPWLQPGDPAISDRPSDASLVAPPAVWALLEESGREMVFPEIPVPCGRPDSVITGSLVALKHPDVGSRE